MGGALSSIMISHQQLLASSLLASSLQATLASPVRAATRADIPKEVEPEQLDLEPLKDFKRPLTRAYPAPGYFTGVRSSVLVPQAPAAVYESLSKDLQRIFGPIEECKDKLVKDDGKGQQSIQRDVKIPFKISYFSSSINMRLAVENNRTQGQITFESVSRSRFLSAFCATFTVSPADDGNKNSSQVTLDAKLLVKKLPPQPLKSLVKGVVVRKMDRCMRDLLDFHVQARNEAKAKGTSANGLTGEMHLPSALRGHQQNAQALTRALARIHSTNRRTERRSLL